jgi:hypothetical protein
MSANAPTPIPSKEQQPLTCCGICSAQLCAHLRCRVCGICEQCEAADPSPAHLLPRDHTVSTTIGRGCGPAKDGLDGARVPNPIRDARYAQYEAMRRSYLRRCGISEEELEEAMAAMAELRSDCCRCHNRKAPFISYCRTCMDAIPPALHAKLALHFAHGYLDYWRQANSLLNARQRREK